MRAVLRGGPRAVLEAVRTAWAFRGRRSLLPSRPLLDWRIATAYGSASAAPDPEDVTRFLAWRRALRLSLRSEL